MARYIFESRRLSKAEQSTWELILQTEQSPVCAFDREYRITAFNQAHADGFLRLYGFRMELGQVLTELVPPDHGAAMRGFMSRALAGEIFDVAQDLGAADSSSPHWQISYKPLRGAAGEIVGAFYRAQDISARLRTEARLAEAQRAIEESKRVDNRLRAELLQFDDRLRNLADPGTIANLAAETVGRVLDLGSAGFGTMRADGETMDVSRDWTAPGAISIVGTHWMARYGGHLDILLRGEDLVVHDVESDPRQILDSPTCLAAGARSVVNVPVTESGKLVGIFYALSPKPRAWTRAELEFIRNIAERTHIGVERRSAERALRRANETLERRVEQALAERETHFRFLAEALPIGILSGSPDSRIDYINPWAERVLGLRFDPGYEDLWRTLIHPDDRPMVQQRWAAMASGGPAAEMEYRQRTLDDGYRWFMTRAVLVRDAQNVPVRIIASIMDIEELVRARQAAEDAAHAKSSFLSTMSHEIRTPMNAVIGMTSLLQDTPLNAEQRALAQTIRSSGDHLLNLINDILDFSRIESGVMELEHQSFSLRESLETALDLVAPKASSRRLELLLQMEYGVPNRLLGDAGRLRQVLINLLANAIKFTEAGEVALSVRAGPRNNGHLELQFSVRDTGIGVAPEKIEGLFDAFTQADASISRRFGGSGLGLAICRRLVDLMGGRIWAESEPGRGSRFHFTAMLEVDTQAEGAPELAPPDIAGRRVLVVDDNASNRAVLEGLLARWGVVPVLSPSPRDALDRLWRGEPFDLALLDFHMPEIDGAQLGASIHALASYKQLPLILLSSITLGETGREFAARLTKPVKPSQLFEGIVDVLQKSAERARAQQEPGAERPGQRHPLKLLVAEDNATNQKVATLLLRKLGYEADYVADGLEALLAIERRIYDVVLMDMQMPQMDGLEATREIRRRWPDGERPRIIGLTANALPEDRQKCLAAGMDDYLSKPVTLERLAEALQGCTPRAAPP